MEKQIIILAFIAIIPTILVGVGGPALTVWLQGRGKTAEKEQEAAARRLEKEQDWRRQDEVAARAAEASRKMLENQAISIAAVEAGTEAAAVSMRQTSSHLEAITTMVDGSLTATIQAELDSTRRELIALREIMAIKITAGREPSIEALAVIETAERRIVELQSTLADRHRRDAIAKDQIEVGKTEGKIALAVAAASKPAAEEAARKVVPPVVTETVPPVVKAAVKEALAEHDKGK